MELYIREPENATQCSGSDLDDRLRHLGDLHATMRQTLQDRNNRREALTWAIDSVARLPPPPAEAQRRTFCGPLVDAQSANASAAGERYATELLRMFCELHPAEATAVLQRYRPQAVERFFQGDGGQRRIAQWFDHFGSDGTPTHGAAALAAFALAHRADVWQLLKWCGSHPHAPVTVAAAPQYFAQLDVQQTVQNLLRECPRFWESRQLAESLQGGQLLRLEPGFFAAQLLALLRRDGGRGGSDRDRWAAERLRDDVAYFVAGTQYPAMCRRLLHLLPEPALVETLSCAADHLPDAVGIRSMPYMFRAESRLPPNAGCSAAGMAASRLVFSDTRWGSLTELLLAHAAAFRAVELWRWLHDDEECLQAASRALAELQRPDRLHVLWALRRHASRQPSDEATRLLLGEKFAAHVRLHESVAGNAAQLERLMQLCGWRFSRVDSLARHALLDSPPRKKNHKTPKKHKHKHKKISSKKRKRGDSRSASPARVPDAEVGTEAAVGGDVTTWEVQLPRRAGAATKCSAQQLHAEIALHMLAVWRA